MPIKPDLRKRTPPDKGGFTGKRGRDNIYDYRQYNSDPTTKKVDRERPSPKSDKEKSRIFDTDSFKKAIEDAQKNFGSRINP